jgi:hypothetical protein
MSTAKHNNAIKTLLEATYGKGKVWVRGSRGTAYGWVTVYIDVGTKFNDKSTDDRTTYLARRDEQRKVSKLIADAKIEGSKINVNFRVPFDVLEKRKAS